jgi:hypothetical protein
MFDTKWMWRNISQDYKYMPWVNILKTPPNLYERLYLAHESDILNKIFKHKDKEAGILMSKYDNGFAPFTQPYNNVLEIRKSNITKVELDKFIKLIKMIRKNDIQLIFIETPEYAPDVKSDSVSANEDLLKSIAKGNKIEFLDYNQGYKSGINFDRSCFSDWDHLNYMGAQRFSKMLSNDINELIKTGKICLN